MGQGHGAYLKGTNMKSTVDTFMHFCVKSLFVRDVIVNLLNLSSRSQKTDWRTSSRLPRHSRSEDLPKAAQQPWRHQVRRWTDVTTTWTRVTRRPRRSQPSPEVVTAARCGDVAFVVAATVTPVRTERDDWRVTTKRKEERRRQTIAEIKKLWL